MPVGGLLPDASQQLGEARLAVGGRRFHVQEAGERPQAVELVLKTRHERRGAGLAVALSIETDEHVAPSQVCSVEVPWRLRSCTGLEHHRW